MSAAGLTVVIVREDLLGKARKDIPTMLDWKVMADNCSMYNTPPTYCIYIAKLVYEWILSLGGLKAMQKRNEKKAAQQLDEFLTCGNIKGSVNFPAVSIPYSEKPRVCIMNKNIPNMLSQITAAFSAENINIENLANGSKGEIAYTIVETNVAASGEIISKLQAIDGVFGVRVFA